MSQTFPLEFIEKNGDRFTANLTISDQMIRRKVVRPSKFGAMHGINIHTRPASNTTTQEKKIKFCADNGIKWLRHRFYPENWFADKETTVKEILATAEAADKYGLQVLYVPGMQYDISTKFGGHGFPPEMIQAIGGASPQAFMRQFYNNAGLWNGRSPWNIMARFMAELAELLVDHPSTLGYMPLNEPPIFDPADNVKLKAFVQYCGEQIQAEDPEAFIFVNHRQKKHDGGNFWDLTDIKAYTPDPAMLNNRLVWTFHQYFDKDEGDKFMLEKLTEIQRELKLPMANTEWNIKDIAIMDIARMKHWIDGLIAKNIAHCLWSLDGGVQTQHIAYDSKYVETPRKIMTAYVKAIGRAGVIGSPK